MKSFRCFTCVAILVVTAHCGTLGEKNCNTKSKNDHELPASDKQAMSRNTTCKKDNLSCHSQRRSCTNQFASAVRVSCYCDGYCKFFQDCCDDYSEVCKETETKDNLNMSAVNEFLLSWSCVDIGRNAYWMKINCSKSWQKAEVALRCVHAPLRLNSSTPMDYIPVLGRDNITYRNQHCAQCNNQNNFKFWSLSLSLSFLPVGQFVESVEDFIDFLVEFEEKNAIEKIVVPGVDMPRRYCRNLISSTHVAHGKIVEKVPDFYLTINFKYKSRSKGYSFNYACRSNTYDHHLKACVAANDIIPPVETPLDMYRIAVWLISPNNVSSADFQKLLTDVEPSNIFNAKAETVQKNVHMIKFDVKLTLNQSIELLKKNNPRVDQISSKGYSILKFIKPFVRPFTVSLGTTMIKNKVIKTSSRRLGCVGLQIYTPSEYTNMGNGVIHVYKIKQNYTRDRYFMDKSSHGKIKVCDRQLPTDCDGLYFKYKRNDFEVRANLSLYHKLQGELYKFGQYTLDNDTVFICQKVDEDDGNVIRGYLTFTGLCLSSFCLIVVFVTYMTFSQLRTGPGKNVINLTVGLVLFNVTWFVSQRAIQNRSSCVITAFVIQYFMLLVHVSMAKIARDTLCMFTDPISHQRKSKGLRVKIFFLLWLIPMIYVVVCFTLYHFNVLDIQYTKSCWFSGPHVYIIAYIPVSIAMAFNILCFIRSILMMRRLEQSGQMLRAQKQKTNSMFIYIKIAILLGLGWTSSFISVPFEEFSYVFIVLTAFQGVYIFLAFICKKNVLLLYRNRLCKKKEPPVAPPVALRSENKVLL